MSVARCDSLLHVCVCRKSLAFQVFRMVSEKLEITVQDIGTEESLVQLQAFKYGVPFRPLKKCLAENRFATDADLKQAVTSCLQVPNTHFVCAVIQGLLHSLDKCLNVAGHYVLICFVPSTVYVV